MMTDPVTAKTYLYFSSNGLLRNTPSPWTSLDYDAFDRLLFTEYPTTYYVFDAASGGGGNNLIAQYDASNVLQKRFVFDDRGSPLVEYDASGNRTFLESDERGSVIALANDSATVTAIDTYDEYGIPSATNQGTFQYTGAMWLSGPALYLNGFRDYGAHVGRFNQTDPMGYGGDGPNLYAYVLNDPVNFVDRLGLCQFPRTGSVISSPHNETVTCPRWDWSGSSSMSGIGSSEGGSSDPGAGRGGDDQDEQKLPQCELKWLQSKLAAAGVPTSDLNQITFHNGLALLSSKAFTFMAYVRSSTKAVTQGNDVFVKQNWREFTTPGNPGRFEEILHTRQFAGAGAAIFYEHYALGIVSGALRGDSYAKNPVEMTAKEAAQSLAIAFKAEKPCP